MTASPNLSRRFVAEVVGTFFLVIAALLSPQGLTFALVGATLLVMVIALGQVSGAHLNPAVTVGLVAARLFPLREGLVYFLAQVIGAFLALGFGHLVGRNLPVAGAHSNAVWFEMLGTALLVFVVVRVVMAKAAPEASALAIGLALTVGIAIAGPSSGGVLNPAIALVLLTGDLLKGSLIANLLYFAAPLVAGAVAALLARSLAPAGVAEEDRQVVTTRPTAE
ncbi:aquaporin [Deinococcus aluminii]|uniref:Aquaporin Z n=1 Tax=Deinococcus aluminii TaxID=1656885 RepID=A0ABP9XF59_9DEIO